MTSLADHRRPRKLAAVGILGLVLSGCGDDPTPTAATDQQTTTVVTSAPSPATALTTTLPLTPSTTAGARSLVPTTALPSVADARIGKSLIPEATTGYEVEPTTINGVQYANALRIGSQRTAVKVEINASRSRQRFLGTLGIPDDQKSSTSIQVEISLDNAPAAFSTVVNFGETKKIDLDVTNALRVKVTVLTKTGESSSPVIAIGDPRFA